jgi:hypothetical protein
MEQSPKYTASFKKIRVENKGKYAIHLPNKMEKSIEKKEHVYIHIHMHILSIFLYAKNIFKRV